MIVALKVKNVFQKPPLPSPGKCNSGLKLLWSVVVKNSLSGGVVRGRHPL